MRRVLLVDFAATGHHRSYWGWLGEYARSQGWEVGIALPNDVAAQVHDDPSLAAFHRVHPIGSFSASSSNPIAQTLREAGEVRRLVILACANGYDVVHFLYLDGHEIGVSLGLLATQRMKAVATLFWPSATIYRGGRVVKGGRKVLISAAALLGRLRCLFVHTEHQHQLLLSEMPALGRRAVVVPDPVEEPAITLGKSEARDVLDLPGDKRIVLFFGGLRRDKGPDVIVQAMPFLSDDWVLVIAGEGKEAEHLRSLANELGCSDRIVFRVGYVPEREVSRYFFSADVVALPYRTDFLGTSGVLGRAAVHGVPIVGTRVGEIGDVISDYDLGAVVRPNDPAALAAAIQRLAGHAAQARNPEEFLRRHHWKVMAQGVFQEYLAMAEDSGRGRARRSKRFGRFP